HEYTHGLSNRLVTDAGGYGALNTAQSGAMGEGWSDWYAQDFIVGQFPELDTAAAGEVAMGAYTDLGSAKLRTQPLDCPVDTLVAACTGRAALGTGGYTYGDFGKVAGQLEVHGDGEIWAQTLWDVRTALGVEKARALITGGMALLGPEPSFLDARNGILLADQNLYSGADLDALWRVFAARGMGYFAASLNGDDTAPAESFALPPASDGPAGTISGRVTSTLGGGPAAGVEVRISGVRDYVATTDADGRYTLAGVPEGTYRKVVAGGQGWDRAVTSLTVAGGATIAFDPVLKRNWAATGGGAAVTATTGGEYADYGCGPTAALDQISGTGWSTYAPSGAKSFVVRLPETIDVTEFGIDPSEACGDTLTGALGQYRVETSATGTSWTVAATGTFTTADRGRLNLVTPSAGASGVRYARVTLLSSQGAGAQFRDLSEFAVYGARPGAAVTIDSRPPAYGNDSTPTFAFSSAEPGVAFECALDDGAFGVCTSPWTLGPLADGFYTFRVRAVGGAEVAATFTISTVRPVAAITGGPSGLTNDARPEFTLASSPPGATFTCALDDAVPAPCTSPLRLEVTDGAHTLTVRAVDQYGNVSDPVTRQFVVDTEPPETAITSGPPAEVHAGPVAFSVRFDEGRVDCSLDGVAASCSTIWRAEELALGEHVFRAWAVDAAGNADPTPAEHRFTVVNAAPTATLAVTGGALTATVDAGGSDPDGDALTYTLDFGDGATATGALPVRLPHAYAQPGEYTVQLTVSDGRATARASRTVTVTALPRAALSLTLSAADISFGAFVPGLARDYDAGLRATVGGAPATLTVADLSGVFPGRLVATGVALAQPLRVRDTTGAYVAVGAAPVVVPAAIALRQSIGAGETLRAGAYAKALTFSLAVTTP
ncbi:MAG TPA: M36 family metallopeptidase, partial [Solirubrobacter sp.]|nr:M36 family metallopeptidase [Solirubrobacter sp.]